MNSPRLPAACADVAKSANAAVSAPAASGRTRSEVGSELNTAWSNHRSATLQPGKGARLRMSGMSLARITADREVENGAEHETHAAHCESGGRDIAVALGRVDGIGTARRAAVVLAVEILLALHRHHAERGTDT